MAVSALGPIHSATKITFDLRCASNSSRICTRLKFGFLSPLGRPKCASKTGAPPFCIIVLIVGTIFLMRVTSDTFPFTIGTLRSTRVRTRFPFKLIWLSVFQDITFTFTKHMLFQDISILLQAISCSYGL